MTLILWHITRSARHVRPSFFNHGPSSVPRPRHLRHPSRKFISVLTTGSRSSFAFLSRLAAPKLLPPWRSPHSAFSRQPHKSNQPTTTQPVPITTTQLNSTNRDHAPQLEHHPPPWFSPGRCLYVSLGRRAGCAFYPYPQKQTEEKGQEAVLVPLILACCAGTGTNLFVLENFRVPLSSCIE